MERKIDLAAHHYILLEEGSANKKVPFCMRLVGLDGADRTKQQQVRRRIEKLLSEVKTTDFPMSITNAANTEPLVSPLSVSSNSSGTFSTSASSKKAYRLTSSQVQKERKRELEVKKNKQNAHSEATALYYKETLKENGLSSEKIVANVNRKYNTNLAASTICRYVQNGQVGMLPKRAGPTGLISDEPFHALCGAYRTFVLLVQAEGLKERSRKQLQALVNAVVNKKEGEGARRNDNLLKRILKETADCLVCGSLKNIEARRNKSTTYQSLNQWFDFMSDFFVSMGFAAKRDEATLDTMEETSEEGELFFYPGQKNRICNFDEVGLSLDGGSSRGGRPSVTFFDPEMPRPGSSTNKSNFTFTMLIGSNAAGEVFPPHFQFPTASKSEDQQWSPEILTGMHQVRGKYGHEEEKYFSPTFGANEKGGMDATEFEKFQLTTMHHYFPDARDVNGHRVCQQLDSGPGRMNHTMLPRLRLQGIRITLKLPNSTHVSQEMDQLFSFFKSIFRSNLEVLTEYQLRKDGKTSIGRFHVGLLIFGGKIDESDEDSPILRNCYMEAFSKEHVLRAWAKVGVVPMTRACLKDPNVHHEITTNGDGQTEDADPLAEKYAALERENSKYNQILKQNGYDGDLLHKTLPRKNMDQRRQALTMPHTKERQELLAKAKTAGAIFLATGGIDICGDDMLKSFGLKEAEQLLNEMTNRRKQALAAKDREQKALDTIVEREGKSYRVKDLEILIRWKLGTGIPGSIKGLTSLKEKWDELQRQPAAECEKWTDEDEERYQELQAGASSQNTDYGRLEAVRQHELMNSVDTMSADQLQILQNRLNELRIGNNHQAQEP